MRTKEQAIADIIRKKVMDATDRRRTSTKINESYEEFFNNGKPKRQCCNVRHEREKQ